jgi:hypothetical protein
MVGSKVDLAPLICDIAHSPVLPARRKGQDWTDTYVRVRLDDGGAEFELRCMQPGCRWPPTRVTGDQIHSAVLVQAIFALAQTHRATYPKIAADKLADPEYAVAALLLTAASAASMERRLESGIGFVPSSACAPGREALLRTSGD